VNFLAIHIHVVTVVADKGESIAEMANKEAPTRKSEVAQPNTRNAAHFTICRANVNRRILDGGRCRSSPPNGTAAHCNLSP
jgi:hypothetical protein